MLRGCNHRPALPRTLLHRIRGLWHWLGACCFCLALRTFSSKAGRAYPLDSDCQSTGVSPMSEELRLSPIETRGVAGKKRYAMVIDVRRCIGCMACQVACKAEYDTPLGVNRTWVPYKVVGTYPNVKKHFLPRLCNHCDDPPCVRACPVGATYKVEDGGFVLQHYERCIGCRSCMAACPYNARFMLPSHRT